MAFCSSCGAEVTDENAVFCPSCGAGLLKYNPPVKKEPNPTALVTLCVLTIIGSLFGIIRGFFYEAIAGAFGNSDYLYGYMFAGLNAGTLVAAILMLLQKR